jgi:predicted ester cyclase
MEEPSSQVVRTYVADVLNRGDAEVAKGLIADETLRHRMAAFRLAFPDLHVATDEWLAGGELVAGHFTGTGTHLGVFQGCPATGRRWRASCTAIYRVREGQIVDSRANWDLLGLLEQLGCVRRVATVSA